MKRIIVLPIFLIILIALLSVYPSAAESSAYAVRVSDGVTVIEQGDRILGRGSLTELLSLVPDGSTVSLDGICVAEELTVSSSLTLTGAFSCVAISVEQGVTLTLRNATVATVDSILNRGSLALYSSFLSCREGVAVKNYGELSVDPNSSLTGLNYSIITDKAVNLPQGHRGPLRISYNGQFPRGSSTPLIITGVGAEVNADVFDKDGRAYPLTQTESGVLSVHLPFKVRLFAGSQLLSTISLMDGEPLSLKDAAIPKGFVNNGWYSSEELSYRISDGYKVSSDMDLYADLSLASPNFSLEGLDLTYDGRVHLLSLRDLYHPLMEQGCFYYCWMDSEGREISSAESLGLTRCADSGYYRCRLTMVVGKYSVSVLTDFVAVRIAKAPVTILSPLTAPDVVYGGEPSPSVITDYGTPTYEYSDKQYGAYSTTPPGAVGLYFVRARIEEGEDHLGLLTESVSFSITPDSPISMWIEQGPERLEYRAFDTFDPSGMIIGVRYKSGSTGYADYSELEFIYPDGSCFHRGDGWVRIGYLGLNLAISVTVRALEYTDLPDFPSITLTYDGSYRTPAAPTDMPVGLDGISLGAYVEGGGTDAGVYTVTLVFYSQSSEYSTPPPIIATLTVLPCSRELNWHADDFVYDGSLKRPEASYLDVFGVRRYARIEGGSSVATDNAVAYAVEEKNYTFVNHELHFAVSRADYDMSAVIISAGEFVYDNTVKRVSVSGLPVGVTVASGTGDYGVRAGTYLAMFSFNYDRNNYNEPILAPFEWSIVPASYSQGSFRVSDGVFEYDGLEKLPIISGEFQRGLDGSYPAWTVSAGAINITDGPFAVTVTFTSSSDNYLAPEPVTAYVTVLPRGIEVEWSDIKIEYDGLSHSPTASSEYASITVLGSAINVGEYSATAVSNDPNYRVINDSQAYSVLQADNALILPPTAEDIYFGHSPTVTVSALFGNPRVEFFADSELTVPLSEPLPVGTVYYRIVVDGDENYKGLVSQGYSFTVLENLPLTIEVRPTEVKPHAFGSVEAEHFTAMVGFSDGSIRDMTAECRVEHSVDALTVGPLRVTVLYGELSCQIELEVVKADLDMSGVRWTDTSLEYSGNILYPTLTGLPSGILSVTLSGVDSAEVGSYLVVAEMEYDRENYNDPGVLSTVLTVSPRLITPDAIESVVYDGVAHTPSISSPYYRPISEEFFLSAGVYEIRLELIDPQRYSLSTDVVIFEILRRPVTLAAEDIEYYLTEQMPEPSFRIAEGTLVDGNYEVSLLIDGDTVRISAKGDNYDFTLIDGAVVRHNTLPPATLRATLLSLFGMIVLSFVLILIRRNHRRRPPSPPQVTDIPPSGERLDTVDAAKADSLITDDLAKTLLRSSPIPVSTEGVGSATVSVSAISAVFARDDRVDINSMKDKGLVPPGVLRVSVVGDGAVDKALKIRANDFDPTAIKMIALTGGEAIKVRSSRL